MAIRHLGYVYNTPTGHSLLSAIAGSVQIITKHLLQHRPGTVDACLDCAERNAEQVGDFDIFVPDHKQIHQIAVFGWQCLEGIIYISKSAVQLAATDIGLTKNRGALFKAIAIGVTKFLAFLVIDKGVVHYRFCPAEEVAAIELRGITESSQCRILHKVIYIVTAHSKGKGTGIAPQLAVVSY